MGEVVEVDVDARVRVHLHDRVVHVHALAHLHVHDLDGALLRTTRATLPPADRREGVTPSPLDLDRLDVYRCAIQLVALCIRIANGLPRGQSDLRDQLRRASTSIPLNVAEGVGKTSEADRARFYAIARGSAYECAALLDVLALLGVIDGSDGEAARSLLTRIVAMLTKMARR